MNHTPPLYEKIIEKNWKSNAVSVSDQLDKPTNRIEPKLLEKIRRHVVRFEQIDNNKALKKLIKLSKKDILLAAHFATNPLKQNICQKIARKWLKRELGINKIKRLKAKGAKAFYVDKAGKICNVEDATKPSINLNFKWKINEYTFYAKHIYTKEKGGGQENAKRAAIQLLENYKKAGEDKKTVLVIIVDGQFYHESDNLDELKTFENETEPKSIVANIEQLPEIMRSYSET